MVASACPVRGLRLRGRVRGRLHRQKGERSTTRRHQGRDSPHGPSKWESPMTPTRSPKQASSSCGGGASHRHGPRRVCRAGRAPTSGGVSGATEHSMNAQKPTPLPGNSPDSNGFHLGSPRGFEPRTYVLRVVRPPPRATLLLVHLPACPGMCGHPRGLLRGISGAFRDQAGVPVHGLIRLSSSAICA
jgi:hypothetical protein